MYNEILQATENISVYPLISLLIFVLFFVSLLVWVIKADKKYINKMSSLPLESGVTFNKLGGNVNDTL